MGLLAVDYGYFYYVMYVLGSFIINFTAWTIDHETMDFPQTAKILKYLAVSKMSLRTIVHVY